MSRAVPNHHPNRIQQGLFANLVVSTSSATSAAAASAAASVEDDSLPGDIEGSNANASESKSKACFPSLPGTASMYRNRQMALRRDK
jgi:hypothetical protein